MTLKKIHMTLGQLLVNSEFKMAVLEINRNDINWFMGPTDLTCTRQKRMKPVLFVIGTYPSIKVDHQIWMGYLYDAIFKMAASEVILRFRL